MPSRSCPTRAAKPAGSTWPSGPGAASGHLLVDTLGLVLVVTFTSAAVQDRPGGRAILARLADAFPTVGLVWADGGYANRIDNSLPAWAAAKLRLVVAIGQRGPWMILPAELSGSASQSEIRSAGDQTLFNRAARPKSRLVLRELGQAVPSWG
jgi:hypothetical protein